MKKINLLLTSIFMFFSFSHFSQSKTTVLHGVTFYTEIKLAENNLVLNGGGLREKYFIDLYVGALFLQQKSKDASKILNADAPM
ncbi:MAG: chalcone isomerase family protein, partial [Flavobacteriia bacterium]|nr:chalcone isomerase family protein [Flavobacteriia bacterium]